MIHTFCSRAEPLRCLSKFVEAKITASNYSYCCRLYNAHRWVPFDITSPLEWREWATTHPVTLTVYGLGGFAAVAAAGYLLATASSRGRRA